MPPVKLKPISFMYSLSIGFLICHLVIRLCNAGSDLDSSCSRTNTSLLNFTSEFYMVQHQLRGVLTVIDDCSFRVSQFDMLQGSDDVHWWGASGETFENLTNGFVVSDHVLNQTYKNDSFIVNLRKNVTWDQINAISVWDSPTASDFGHIVFNTSSNFSDVNGTHLLPPTMFDNCKVLTDDYRVRWSLSEGDNAVDIGLEAALGIQYYMAFGWASPNATDKYMVGADVVFTGFQEDMSPIADDFYITDYSECVVNKDGKFQGVCPDTIFEGSDPVGLVNDTKLTYAHRKDGVSFIRYRRLLKTLDQKYDVVVDHKSNMSVIWALGQIKPPDSLRPFYLPQNHGGTYGNLFLNLSEPTNDCLGPLDAKDKEDEDLIIADKKDALVVSTGPASHYPNPPNPSKVLYINKKQAPLLRVERGVPVKFSIQAGHDVALYVTSDPIGGNATLRNMSETVYFGGPEAEGVLATPKEMIWSPDRNTPDLVYYHSIYTQKMGWKIQVVDGGLADMYNNSVVLDDQQVKFYWTLSKTSISIAVRGEKKSGYLAIAFGRSMINSFAYVGWIDDNGKGHVNTYWIDGKDASSLHPTHENLTYVRCKSENGVFTFEFTRPLRPSCNDDEVEEEKPECNNIIDSSTPLKVIWAMGAQWSNDHLTQSNMHSVTSKRPVHVLLMRGSAEADEDLRPVLGVHGFMMFLAWGILIPGGILSARYLKHLQGDGWFQIHVYLQYSGLAIVFLGFLFAVAELQGFDFHSLHAKFGLSAILLAVFQPVNAYFRPKKSGNNNEEVSSRRIIWEYVHVIVGRCAIPIGIIALFTGMKHLKKRYGEDDQRLTLALIIWFLIGALTVVYLEYREKNKRRERTIGSSSDWVLGNIEEEHLDLLSPSRMVTGKGIHASDLMEIQLEPLSR